MKHIKTYNETIDFDDIDDEEEDISEFKIGDKIKIIGDISWWTGSEWQVDTVDDLKHDDEDYDEENYTKMEVILTISDIQSSSVIDMNVDGSDLREKIPGNQLMVGFTGSYWPWFKLDKKSMIKLEYVKESIDFEDIDDEDIQERNITTKELRQISIKYETNKEMNDIARKLLGCGFTVYDWSLGGYVKKKWMNYFIYDTGSWYRTGRHYSGFDELTYDEFMSMNIIKNIDESIDFDNIDDEEIWI